MKLSKDLLEAIDHLNAAVEDINEAKIADDRIEEILQEAARAAGFRVTFKPKPEDTDGDEP